MRLPSIQADLAQQLRRGDERGAGEDAEQEEVRRDVRVLCLEQFAVRLEEHVARGWDVEDAKRQVGGRGEVVEELHGVDFRGEVFGEVDGVRGGVGAVFGEGEVEEGDA